MKKPQFVDEYIYHIYNRGVEKRKIFLDKDDYLRFIHDLFEFNDEAPVFNVDYYFDPKSMEVKSQYIMHERKPRKLLVEILAFTLMPNHFHLMVRQKTEKGIVRFMQKLGTGYTMYFNGKNNRVGGLFQNSFKAVLISQEPHFTYLPTYIHANPLKLIKHKSIRSALKFLEEYRWSSLPDYLGKKNFPSVTSRSFLLDFYGGIKEYRKEIISWIQTKGRVAEEISDVTIDDYGVEN